MDVTRNFATLRFLNNQQECYLHYPTSCRTLPAWFGTFLAADRSPPQPPAVHLFENVVVAGERRQSCLYDAEGRRIELSRVPARYPDAPDEEDEPPPRRWAADEMETIEEPALFQSAFFWHWGHFLLESSARLWAKVMSPDLAELPSLYAWPMSVRLAGDAYGQVLSTLGVRPLRRSKPATRLAKCFVPSVTYASRAFAHEWHLSGPHRVAQRLWAGGRRDDRPVYLSRTRLGLGNADFRAIDNEAELESRLAARGVRIAHMQEMTLAEQMALMNTHSVFISPLGSAMHNIVFSLSGREATTFLLIEEFLPANYLLIDGIVNNAAHYMYVLSISEQTEKVTHLRIDVDATLNYLRACGVV